jgi:sulfoquinovosidase
MNLKKFQIILFVIVLVKCSGLGRGELVKNSTVQKFTAPASTGLSYIRSETAIQIVSLPNKTVYMELPLDKTFLIAGIGKPKVKENLASYHFKDSIDKVCNLQTLDSIQNDGKTLDIQGKLTGKDCDTNYLASFKLISPKQIDFNITLTDKTLNRIQVFYKSDESEQFFGFGEQFTHFNMKGKEPFLFTEEQGIGRGDMPITFGANLTEGAGGNEYTSYAPIPHYITTKNKSVFFENTTYSKFDLKDPNEVSVLFWENSLKGTIWQAASPLELIELYTAKTGRNPELPDWAYGSWMGVQAGEISVPAFENKELKKYAKLNKILDDAKNAGNPISALWIQDWCGRRITGFGDQLKWRWYADDDMYPNLKEFIAEQNKKNVKVLGYINSFLADVDPRVDFPEEKLFSDIKKDKLKFYDDLKDGQDPNTTMVKKKIFSNPMLEEAKKLGFLVKNNSGEDYKIRTVGFPAYLIDLSNPAAVKWTKDIIKKNMIDIGLSGWMADFGEWLPFDAKMFNGESGESYHNKYPVEWARVNREAIVEAKKEGQIVFFTRAGYSYSNKYSTAFWAGDQLVNFGEHDGLPSTVVGLTTSGISGLAINHSDIGGYTTITNPLMLGKYKRTKETFLRWTEMNAFTPVYRTHEGNKPKPNHQPYTDKDTIEFFARFGKIHFALKDYLKELGKEAKTKGYPIVRATYLHYPEDPNTFNLRHQFMLGADLLMLPVVKEGDSSVEGYLPAGEWEHLFTGKVYAGGKTIELEAPIGTPAVFLKKGSNWSEKIKASMKAVVGK